MNKSRSKWEIVSVGLNNGADLVLIRDLDQGLSVTNDAENVVQDLLEWRKREFTDHGMNLDRRMVIHYIDTMGERAELMHDGVAFMGFKMIDQEHEEG
jgi:hypothetical protein